ncbi:peptidyl-prolyl cis-trans isomerase E-like [Aphis craccivora]|uniref:Peptidyl-prolyl cis-trans isomerase E-like n=1 Tax=Aphis craccivora TaxID=307492 RepID=A0A6G0YP27_APHCR|nr:peptidyl-prolyl cis-trans isomerase E-like [Aphis craccivora]
MQNKLTRKASWEDMYRKHRNNVKNDVIRSAKPKVDNKPPLLKITAYYKPGTIEANTARLAQIEEDNFKLIRNINIIYRTKRIPKCYRAKDDD